MTMTYDEEANYNDSISKTIHRGTIKRLANETKQSKNRTKDLSKYHNPISRTS